MTDSKASGALHDVSRETLERLEIFDMLLRRWNETINLVSSGTLDSLWVRHFQDSAQIFELATKTANSWVDMGSGAGFPGLVVAILAAEKAPDLDVTLIESNQRKAAFLTTVLREAGIRANVIAERIEIVEPRGADVISARALAPLDRLLAHASRHIAPEGMAIFPKGANHDEELRRALESWRFSYQKWPSQTDPEAVILAIEGISRV